MSKLFKILVGLISFAGTGVFAQCPPNIGFENGNFNGWICGAGDIDSLGNIFLSGNMPLNNRHTIIKGNSGELDKFGHFPIVCPNGSKYSVRLGNDIPGHQAEQVSYQFIVPPGKEYSLIFYCAVVLQNPAHESYQQPRFTAHVYNVTDSKPIDCPAFDFIASYNVPGFKLSDVIPEADPSLSNGGGGGGAVADVYYKDWTATTINLEGYAGKTVRLAFTTNDCTFKAHFGYAYIDINEECKQAISGNTYCAGQNVVTLKAPVGFDNYKWYSGDLTTFLGSGASLNLNPAPDNLKKYAVVITPFPGLGCADTLYTTINKIETEFKLIVPDTVWGCQGSGVDLTAASVTAGTTPGTTFEYFVNPTTLIHIQHPEGVDAEGIYYILGTSIDGCTNILPVQVKLHPQPSVTITDPLPVQYPQTVDLSAVYKPIEGQTYSYYADAAGTMPLTNYKHINTQGKYYIRATNEFGCITTTYTTVKINGPAPYKITAPNVFTPNNDGVNDFFSIQIDGFVDFGSIKIYNRYGQMVFTSKSSYDLWNGNYNGQPLPPGTYYWVFEGTDQYYHTKVTKGGPISIAR